MLTIPISNATIGFVCDVHIERTARIVDKVVELSREELIDTVFYLIDALDKVDGTLEKSKQIVEECLGLDQPFSLKYKK